MIRFHKEAKFQETCRETFRRVFFSESVPQPSPACSTSSAPHWHNPAIHVDSLNPADDRRRPSRCSKPLLETHPALHNAILCKARGQFRDGSMDHRCGRIVLHQCGLSRPSFGEQIRGIEGFRGFPCGGSFPVSRTFHPAPGEATLHTLERYRVGRAIVISAARCPIKGSPGDPIPGWRSPRSGATCPSVGLSVIRPPCGNFPRQGRTLLSGNAAHATDCGHLP